MKEFETPITQLFRFGLRTDKLNSLNNPGCVTCMNLKPSEFRMEGQKSLIDPFPRPLVKIDENLPQLFKGRKDTYLCARHYIYKVMPDYSLVPLTTWFYSAEHWSFADFGPYVVFNNGNLNIRVDISSGDYYFAPEDEIPNCKVLCNFRGQLFIANTDKGPNWVEWSKIGVQDFSLDGENTAGYIPMPWQGQVYALRVLTTSKNSLGMDQQTMLVYGDQGITSLYPVSSPASTYGMELLTYYGIAGKGAVGGDENVHLFVDERGYLRRITAKGIERLGYQEFFEPMLGENITISYDQNRGDFYIAGDTNCYVFSDNQLYEISQLVRTGVFTDGAFVCVKQENLSNDRLFVSNSFDLNIRTIKTITEVLLGSSGNAEVALYWRNNKQDEFRLSSYKRVGPSGRVSPHVSGVEFRLVIRSSDPDIQLDSGYIRWKLTDKRAIRGMYGLAKASAESD